VACGDEVGRVVGDCSHGTVGGDFTWFDLDWQTAICSLRQNRIPAPDILLVDQDSKTCDELISLHTFRSLIPETPLILLANHFSDQEIFAALSLGVAGILVKPISRNDVVAAVDAVVGGYVVFPADIMSRILRMIPSLMDNVDQFGLTRREKDVLKRVVEGKSTQMIANDLIISYHTVNNHLRNIYRKLNVSKRTNLVSVAIRTGIILPPTRK